MGLLNMFLAFFKVGLFTIGGGLVAIPIMQDYVQKYNWITTKDFVDMIAISQSTPGPIGINLATYVGASQYGIFGSIIVTIAMVLPSFIIITIISKFLKHFNENKWVKAVLASIRPMVVGIILAAAYFIASVSFLNLDEAISARSLTRLVDLKAFIVFIIFFILMFKVKKHPILYIVIGGVFGVLLF